MANWRPLEEVPIVPKTFSAILLCIVDKRMLILTAKLWEAYVIHSMRCLGSRELGHKNESVCRLCLRANDDAQVAKDRLAPRSWLSKQTRQRPFQPWLSHFCMICICFLLPSLSHTYNIVVMSKLVPEQPANRDWTLPRLPHCAEPSISPWPILNLDAPCRHLRYVPQDSSERAQNRNAFRMRWFAILAMKHPYHVPSWGIPAVAQNWHLNRSQVFFCKGYTKILDIDIEIRRYLVVSDVVHSVSVIEPSACRSER